MSTITISTEEWLEMARMKSTTLVVSSSSALFQFCISSNFLHLSDNTNASILLNTLCTFFRSM